MCSINEIELAGDDVTYSLPDVRAVTTTQVKLWPKQRYDRHSAYWICTLPKRLAHAALVEKNWRETEISDFMVRRAVEEAEQLQQFPFAQRS